MKRRVASLCILGNVRTLDSFQLGVGGSQKQRKRFGCRMNWARPVAAGLVLRAMLKPWMQMLSQAEALADSCPLFVQSKSVEMILTGTDLKDRG